MSTTPACGKCFDSKECLQFGCQNPERRMETAKDILDRHAQKYGAGNWAAFTTIVGKSDPAFVATVTETVMQEIADKAWEAGVEHGFDPERYYSTEQAKADFMKSLFPLKEI